ncbi:MAG: MG2 domain-containing protein [Saprospiraceae bacterium]|nr:MG2 domain-containing protein [Saprospiraceae bacterium]
MKQSNLIVTIAILLLVIAFKIKSFAQVETNNYDKEWSAIQNAENDGLTKTALELTQKLYDKIIKDKKNPFKTAQTIKALLFLNKYQARLEEDGLVKAIYRFQEEEKKASFPAKPILQSMVAEMYDKYLQSQLYKFRDRTATENYNQEDIRTWDIPKITQKCYELYQSSVQFEETKKINISDFNALIYSGRDVEGLRPTLYDFLVHRALDFFISDRHYMTKPAYRFYLDSESDFADGRTFINRNIIAKDSISSSFQTLILLQKTLAFHIDDKDPKAYINLELKRMEFVKNNSILTNKNELYLNRLKKLEAQYKDHEASTELSHKIALYYFNQGNKYQPSSNKEFRWDLKKAIAICEKSINKFPESFGTSHCKALKKQIENQSLELKVEKVNSINKPILSLLSYKNLDHVYLKAIPVTKAQLNTFNSKYSEAKIKYLNSLSKSYKWSEKLKNEGDFQKHSLEFGVPALKNGQYILAASTNEAFSYLENGIAYAVFYVSNMSLSSRKENGIHNFYVTDRNSGQPLKDIKADFYISKYNSLLRKYETIKINTAISNNNGYFKSHDFNEKGSYYRNSFTIKLSQKDDELHLDKTYYNYRPNNPYLKQSTTFFLDRAIYRPGQIVYFKGLVIDQMSDGKDPQLVTGQSRTIVFYDVNYQVIDKIDVTTNEYGTFQGSFITPSSGLMGQMRIQDSMNKSSKFFSVEEYKRPKFEVIALPIEAAYKIDDTVTVNGHAKAYAGNNIDGAKVQYRVYRQARFPYWNWRWGWYNPYNQSRQEITFGETTTNKKGHYEIKFKALADFSIPKEKKPEFHYTVEVTVTDITGETHSATSSVRVGYIGLDISISNFKNIDKQNALPIKIFSKNLNYQYEASKGQITIEQLKVPETIFKTRYWSKPDYHLFDKEDFEKKFPNFAYKDEDLVNNWKVVKQVLNVKYNTEKSKEFKLDKIKSWKQGRYKLVLKTQDKFGTPIELTKFFTVYGNNENNTPISSALYTSKSNFYDIQPDTSIKIDFGSHNKDAWVLYEIEHNNKIVHKEWLQPKGRKKVNIKIEEKHRGNLHFHLTSIQNGRFYNSGGTIFVPWKNKDLKIEYSTFRDKLYPGQKEEWKIKISGNKGDKVAAEILAGMYDASLDAFATNYWGFNVHPTSYRNLTMEASYNFNQVYSRLLQYNWNPYTYGRTRGFKTLNWHGFSFYEHDYFEGRRMFRKELSSPMDARSEAEPMAEESEMEEDGGVLDMKNGKSLPLQKQKDKTINDIISGNEPEEEDFNNIKVRTNLNETVFFFPELMCDKEGNVIIKFTMNEALTKWKFMVMAHTKDLQSVIETKEVVTQKDLMVMPNTPRFFRENDEINFTAKVSNMTDELMKGNATLQLFDAISMKPIDSKFGNTNTTIPFEAKRGQSTPLVWKLKIPDGWTSAVIHRIVAKAGDFSDGEESALPVLTNRMLVTETQPLPIRGNTTKEFIFKRMEDVSKSTTMRNHKLTLEFTQNPAWYAIQSLPYLMEYPYECTEQIFSRYYANSLASNVANSHPKVKRVFDQWKNIDTDALKSNLSKNEELKYALLEETPWVLAAQSEEVQKKNVGVLFDLNRMGNELAKARDKMAERQLPNGGFSWMPGGVDSWYITQYIVEGMGHLDKLGVKDINNDPKMKNIISKSVSYIDTELALHYKRLLKWAKESGNEKEYLERDHLDHMPIHYIYARTFFLDKEITNKTTLRAIEYYEDQALKYWHNKSMYLQGLLALGLHRKGADIETPMKIVRSAKENSLNSDEMGMYWKYTSGYFWYQLPIETHALMIELFDVVAKDKKAVEDLKVWLLKAKQTTHWKTTKATAAAAYSLLMSGDNWLLDDKNIEITMGSKKLDQSKINKEAGTGYFKTTWKAEEIKPEMANISIKNPNNVIAWGAMYWQYFENLDKITHFKETPLKLNKKLFKQINTDRGPVLKPIENENLVPGDLIKVRIELTVDRDMEYVHMKDMRASGLEPTNVISRYKYQGGLGYYESTGDVATNFFFSYLSKGTYVFEYPLRINHKGDFSNGVTTIQCMYAPEYTAHSEGVRVFVN